MRALLLLGFCGTAWADTTCRPPSKTLRAEIVRLLEVAARHATRSSVCADGAGERTSLQLIAACADEKQVKIRYRVTVAREYGGECDPCPEPEPPKKSEQQAVLEFGETLVIPQRLPGVPLKTPLDKPHSTGCYGPSPAFVPKKL